MKKKLSWELLLTTERMCETQKQSRPGRTEFMSDIDRIIFSGAFRRLGRKTQVHPLAANDHVHTRLTHSLEVASVGRTLGTIVGQELAETLSEHCTAHDMGNLVYAACLAHDIGNPPFGHEGESAIRAWFLDDREHRGGILSGLPSVDHQEELKSFEGNAQGLRRIAQIDNHVFSGGLRLTYATLAASLKYPWTIKNPKARGEKKKYSCFFTEEQLMQTIAQKTGLIRISETEWCRHPLAYLMDAADDICYATIDLEDGVELKIVSYEEVEKVLRAACDEKLWPNPDPSDGYRRNFTKIRGRVYDTVIKRVAHRFLGSIDEIMRGKPVTLITDSDPYLKAIMVAKKFANDRIFNDPKKLEIEIGAYSSMAVLLNAFCSAAVEYAERTGSSKLSAKTTLVLRLLGDHSPIHPESATPPGGWDKYQCLRRALDYVSGMTDNYATYMAKQLMGMGTAGVQRP